MENIIGVALFDDLTAFHHHNSMAHGFYHGKVMTDKDIAEAVFRLQMP